MGGDNIHLISYISNTVVGRPVNNDIDDIVVTSKRMNPRFDVTGVLFYHDGMFMQVIEGEKAHLDQLMLNIVNDNRHEDVRLLIDEAATARGFPSWNMDCFNLSDSEQMDREKMIGLSQEFREILMPRADVFVKFYKVMLERLQAS